MLLSKYLNALIFFDGYFLINDRLFVQKSKTLILTDLKELTYYTAGEESKIVLPVTSSCYSSAKFHQDVSTLARFSYNYKGFKGCACNEPWFASLEEELFSSFRYLLSELNKIEHNSVVYGTRTGAVHVSFSSNTKEDLCNLIELEFCKTLSLPTGNGSRWFQTNTQDDAPEYDEIFHTLLTASETKEELLAALKKQNMFKSAVWMSKVELGTLVSTRYSDLEKKYIKEDYMRRISTAARIVGCFDKLKDFFVKEAEELR